MFTVKFLGNRAPHYATVMHSPYNILHMMRPCLGPGAYSSHRCLSFCIYRDENQEA